MTCNDPAQVPMSDPCGKSEETFFIKGNFRIGNGSPAVLGIISSGKLILQKKNCHSKRILN
jgi:hypothetical protein